MLKTLAAVAALALVPTLASAAETRTFECEVTRVTPAEGNDHNPVVNTVLTNIYQGNRLTGFRVEHELADGRTVVRQEQYRNQRLGQGNMMVAWTGASVKGPGLVMTGTFRQTKSGDLIYTEQLTRNGRVETTIIHACERTA